jgi:DNA-binding GntR family transcriptional regulator
MIGETPADATGRVVGGETQADALDPASPRPAGLRVEALDRRRLSEKVYDLLRAKIVARELRPGERLDVALLARSLGVSVAPVKAAVHQLAAEGVIEVLPQRGTFVASLDWPTLEELFGIRRILETHACESLLGRITEVQLAELRRLLGQMQAHTRGDAHLNYAAYLEVDRAFHTTIVRSLGNRSLTEMYEGIGLRLRLVRAIQAGHTASGALGNLAEHFAILRALEGADPAQARAAVSHHLDQALRRIADRLGDDASEPSPAR